MRKLTTGLIIAYLIIPLSANAIDRNEKSVNFLIQGEKYYEIDNPVHLSRNDKKELNNLYKKISGNWERKEVFTDCRGSHNSMRVHQEKYTLNSKIEKHNKETLKIRSEKEDDGSRKSDSLILFDSELMSSFNKTGNTYHIQEKYYGSMGPGIALLVEKHITFEKTNRHISIQIKSYTNGHFASFQTVDLTQS